MPPRCACGSFEGEGKSGVGKRHGRPKLADNERREALTLNVRFNEEEARVVTEKAATAGVTPTEWARAAALGRTPKARVVVPEINREAWLNLAGLAANFNRTMALINEGRDIGVRREMAEHLQHELTSLRAALLGREGAA